MGDRIERTRKFLASKLWPEYAKQETRLRFLQAAFDGVREHNQWLRKQHRKELDGSIDLSMNLARAYHLALEFAGRIRSMIEGDSEEPMDAS